MRICNTCKYIEECEFGKNYTEIKGYHNQWKDDNDGLNKIIDILDKSIEEYMDCSYWNE